MDIEVGPIDARLLVETADKAHTILLTDRAVTIGRGADCDHVLTDPKASRAHLKVEPRPGGWRAVDIGSQNGTHRNGRRIRSAPLRPGDVLTVGSTRLTFELQGRVETEAPARESDDAQETVTTEIAPVGRTAKESSDSLAARLKRVGEITRALHTAPDDDGLLDQIIDAAVEVTGSERGFLILTHRDGMRFAAARNIEQQDLQKPEFEVSWSIAVQVGTGGEPVLAVDASQDPRFSKLESVESLQLRSVLCVPIQGPTRVMGVIYVDNRLNLGAYCDEDLSVLAILADQAGIALANRQRLTALIERKAEVEKLNDQLRAEVDRQGDEIARMRTALDDTPADRYADYRALLGGSARMDELRHLLRKVSATDFPVLIQGESGTGKELVARCIHADSKRAPKPFVSVNCAAIPETLLENELFGHVRGAFTGADSNKKGLFEAANSGTLFLDEVSEMSSAMQSRLLRVLQEGEVRPVGGKKNVSVDVRVIAASNRDLASMIDEGTFREDLYYRLRVLPVTVPPLRERREDIPELITHFFKQHAEGTPPVVTPESLDILTSHAWPGNVRELENEVKRLSVLAGSVIEKDSISRQIQEAGEMLVGKDSDFQDLGRLVESIETREISKALARARRNKTRAAELLGITRFTLQRKMDKYGLHGD